MSKDKSKIKHCVGYRVKEPSRNDPGILLRLDTVDELPLQEPATFPEYGAQTQLVSLQVLDAEKIAHRLQKAVKLIRQLDQE